MQLDQRLLKYAGKTKKYLYLNVFAKWLTLLGNVIFIFIFAMIWEKLFRHKGLSFFEIGIFSGLFVLSFLIRQGSIRWAAKLNGKVVSEIKNELQNAIFQKILDLGWESDKAIAKSELLQYAVEGIESLESYFGSFIPQFMYCIIADITLFLILLPFNPKAAFLLLIMAPIVPLMLMMMLKKVKKVQGKYWDSYANIGKLFLDSLKGMTTLKIFRAEKIKGSEIAQRSEDFRKKTMRLLIVQLNSITLIDWIIYGTTAAIIIGTISLMAKGGGTVFAVLFSFLLASEFFIPLRLLTTFFHVAMTGVTVAGKIFAFLDLPEVKVPEIRLNDQAKSVQCEGLNFSYSAEKEVLKNIDLQIQAKSLIAFVGLSGSGKSTLGTILAGRYQVSPNTVFIDQQDITKIAASSLQEQVVYVGNDAFLFSGTIRFNLQLVKAELSDLEMIEVLKKVKLWEDLQAQKGLDTEVLLGGANFSGGQVQRLILARALLYEASLYIFDEVSSSVDAASEAIIMQVIKNLTQKSTVIIISHHLKWIKDSDWIYLLKDGEIKEQGVHAELIAIKGMYAKIYQMQEELSAVVGGKA